MKCEDCKYWDKDENRAYYAPCRRRSPQLTQVQTNGKESENENLIDKGFWPFTYQSDWCGEFEAKIKDSWSEIVWSVRLRNIFIYYDVESFEQLTNYTESDLLRMKRLGESSLAEVKAE